MDKARSGMLSVENMWHYMISHVHKVSFSCGLTVSTRCRVEQTKVAASLIPTNKASAANSTYCTDAKYKVRSRFVV